MVDAQPPMLFDCCPCIQGVEQDWIFLTKIVGMMWMQKISRSLPFSVLRSPYWHEMVKAINNAPKVLKIRA